MRLQSALVLQTPRLARLRLWPNPGLVAGRSGNGVRGGGTVLRDCRRAQYARPGKGGSFASPQASQAGVQHQDEYPRAANLDRFQLITPPLLVCKRRSLRAEAAAAFLLGRDIWGKSTPGVRAIRPIMVTDLPGGRDMRCPVSGLRSSYDDGPAYDDLFLRAERKITGEPTPSPGRAAPARLRPSNPPLFGTTPLPPASSCRRRPRCQVNS